MNIFKQYRDYIKDNPEGYWFKRKMYGWGWTPVKWEGWAVIAVFVGLLFLNARRLGPRLDAHQAVPEFLIETIILVAVLIFICYKKGEKPRWTWGPK